MPIPPDGVPSATVPTWGQDPGCARSPQSWLLRQRTQAGSCSQPVARLQRGIPATWPPRPPPPISLVPPSPIPLHEPHPEALPRQSPHLAVAPHPLSSRQVVGACGVVEHQEQERGRATPGSDYFDRNLGQRSSPRHTEK